MGGSSDGKKSSGGGGVNVDASVDRSSKSTVQGVQIKAGGSSQIKGQEGVSLQNTTIDAKTGSQVTGKTVTRSTEKDRSSGTTVNMNMGGVSVERK